MGGEEIPNLLDTVKVFDLNGNEIQISDLWKDRKAVIAFARHFGCVFCRKRADYLASKKDIFDASGVALVLIGPGSIDQAKAFSEQTKFKGGMLLNEPETGASYYISAVGFESFDFGNAVYCEAVEWMTKMITVIGYDSSEDVANQEVYADPSHSSYEALRFVSGVTTTFTPKAGLKIIQLYMEGYRQDWKLSFQKDTVARGGWQQGGIIVAGPGKTNISYIHKDKEAGDDPDIEDILKACCS
ncbi:Peroxiredoxin-like FAM213/AAED [Parasponia andersonii]|uniref:Peroxiredoxin-like FAM213/AAED n=1 Tax=Parasponia andersonii TaxID=3476 RepID=A0A2P5A7F3_PARAD|nr:Peroxiredoxin-like FAM213/AAED [Parasponia andersonii]